MKNPLLSQLAVGLFGVALLPVATEANLMTGGLSFDYGLATATDSLGNVQPDLTIASQISFDNSPSGSAQVVSASGDFESVLGESVRMFSPLVIRPTTLPD